MALFSFGKKPKKQDQPTAPGSPLPQVMMMMQQGMDTNMMVQQLQQQGYNSQQIYDALNQAQMQVPMQQPAQMPMDPQMQMPMQQSSPYDVMPDFGGPMTGLMPPPGPPEPVQPQQDNRVLVEEIAEAIIDEKWKEFEDDLRKIIEWKEMSESKITQLTQQIQDMNTSLNSLHKNLLNKISEYDRNIVDVGTEIKAMEKVFQKILPSLTENVNKLERMSKDPQPQVSRRPGLGSA